VTVSVVTDAQGRYSFPASRLAAGKYSLNIRAIGYELAAPTGADVADEQTTTVDLKLRKVKDLASQMSQCRVEMSLPARKRISHSCSMRGPQPSSASCAQAIMRTSGPR